MKKILKYGTQYFNWVFVIIKILKILEASKRWN